jgi:hypothetical protein
MTETSPTTSTGTEPSGTGTNLSRRPRRFVDPALMQVARSAADRIINEHEQALPVAAFQSSI